MKLGSRQVDLNLKRTINKQLMLDLFMILENVVVMITVHTVFC